MSANPSSLQLQYLTRNNISFLAQCGGHGNTVTYETVRDAVVIDMQNFNEIVLNDDNTITAGGGAIFGDVYPVAYNGGRELRESFLVKRNIVAILYSS
jgi:fumiquinazoline A oxidase